MKRLIPLFLTLALVLSLGGCGSDASENTPVDLDLTQLSSTMVYAEVFNMMYTPEDYVGRTVRMEGTLAVWHDTERERYYYTCIVEDATACCAQGVEFVWDGHTPEEYPPEGSRVQVVGTFGTYEEDGFQYCQLEQAELTW